MPLQFERLLAKVYVASKAGGRVLIVEFIPNPDRVSPLVAAQFSLWMLATTPGGDAYTFCEYDHMLKKVGFLRCELQEMAPTFFRLVLASK
jgi:O-methyltransferase domain